jgi:hypothetical protein
MCTATPKLELFSKVLQLTRSRVTAPDHQEQFEVSSLWSNTAGIEVISDASAPLQTS